MSLKHLKELELHSLIQIYKMLYSATKIEKISTLGVIVDVSGIYFRQDKNIYEIKLTIIDHTFNVEHFQYLQRQKYFTIYVRHENKEKMPKVRQLGDIIHLRRFKFIKYNERMQGWSVDMPYCSWSLIETPSIDIQKSNIDIYQSSKGNANDQNNQLSQIYHEIWYLLKFSRDFLTKTSFFSVMPSKRYANDEDYIVKVQGILPYEAYVLSIKGEQILLPMLLSNVQVGSFAKLRGVVRFEDQDNPKMKTIVKNAYTSLTAIDKNCYDVWWLQDQYESISKAPELVNYTAIDDIQKMSYVQSKGQKFTVCVQIIDVSPKNFKEAVQYYDTEGKLYPQRLESKDSYRVRPIYKISFTCIDFKANEKDNIFEIHLFSYDRKGSDFIDKIDLEDEQNLKYSNLSQENFLYQQKIEQMMNAQSVSMIVQVLFDEKLQNRLIRVIKVEKIHK